MIDLQRPKWQLESIWLAGQLGVLWLILASFNCKVTLKVFYILAWWLFGQWQHARGLSVQRAISKRSPWRTTRKSAAQLNPEIMPIQKSSYFGAFDNGSTTKLTTALGTTGQVTHMAVTNGPLTVCHPSLGNSQTPRPHTVAHYPKKFLEISWKASRPNDDWSEVFHSQG